MIGQCADLAGGERVGTLPDVRMVFKRKGMFDVQVELVEFVRGHFVGQGHEGSKSGNFSASDIVIESPDREIRPVTNDDAGNGVSA